MSSFKNYLLAGTVAVAGLFGATAANALTYTQTVTFGPALTDYNGTGLGLSSILLFDTNGGTLNSITFSASYGFNSQITLANDAQAQSTSNGNVKTESAAKFSAGTSLATAVLNSKINTGPTAFIGAGSLSPTAYDITGNANGYSLTPGQSTTVTSIGTTGTTGPVTDSTTADLTPFSAAGGGNLAILFSTLTGTVLQNVGGNTSAVQSTTATGTLTITYNYDAPPPPSVPEPASIALLGAGLLGLGLVRRKSA